MTQSATIHSEIVGLLHSPDALENAISELASAGWDHAEMSLLGERELLQSRTSLATADRIAHDPTTLHSAVVSKDDLRQMRTLTTGLAGVVAAFLAAGATIMSGGAALAAIVGAAAAGGGAAAAVEAFGRNADQHREHHLRAQVARGGILLWAIIRGREDETKARDILRRCGATDIEVHTGPAPRDKMRSLR